MEKDGQVFKYKKVAFFGENTTGSNTVFGDTVNL